MTVCVQRVSFGVGVGAQGLLRMRGTAHARYISKRPCTRPVLTFEEPRREDTVTKVREMGLTGNCLVSLLICIFVINEIQLPLVSLLPYFIHRYQRFWYRSVSR